MTIHVWTAIRSGDHQAGNCIVNWQHSSLSFFVKNSTFQLLINDGKWVHMWHLVVIQMYLVSVFISVIIHMTKWLCVQTKHLSTKNLWRSWNNGLMSTSYSCRHSRTSFCRFVFTLHQTCILVVVVLLVEMGLNGCSRSWYWWWCEDVFTL